MAAAAAAALAGSSSQQPHDDDGGGDDDQWVLMGDERRSGRTLEDVFEPHLLRCGYVQKTPRGRVVTAAGLEAVGRDARALQDGAGAAPLFDA